ncbi:uncharacterized protein UV8b_01374 [Ustilaginoidea virens]|uniref:RecQ mediated genome instability protein 1-like N-terminal helical domain-containing protein n=1 Tax=Ustilaginoidea virens TaxID=1159556 RepID=A0A8E5MEC1_USTVR|nr:uncharacterized protein UV8b_01374 [Ustilaginoidea virens]QUC17133.1 hypothetical protein UV8b_01374 [Ustilaginoidea virens]
MDLATQLRHQLIAQSLPPPSQPLLESLVAARSPPPPLPSLVATARTRLLACDLSSGSGSGGGGSSSSSGSSVVDPSQLWPFPPGIGDVHVQEAALGRDTHVQVVDIENLSLSRWEQIEELEAIERGETTRGRRVIRVADDQAGGPAGVSASASASASASQNATHRLVLQDCKGASLYALEAERIPAVGVGSISIGCKMRLRAGTPVARGTLLLTPENCLLLGGKVDAWHDAWVAGRMARLKEAVGAAGPGSQGPGNHGPGNHGPGNHGPGNHGPS